MTTSTLDSADVRAERSRRTATALDQAARATGPDRHALLDEAICLNLPVARSLAARYRNRGLPREDLEQVAYLALTRAVQGFEPEQGKDFLVYAVPTITGELKRYFRDAAWTVRPTRRVQERHAAAASARAGLTQELGRSPSAEELAARLGCTVAEVAEVQSAEGCFRPASLEDRGRDGTGHAVADVLGAEDQGFVRAETVAMLGPACRELSARDRRILFLRFYEQWPQHRIAAEVGVTQMQVSRLLGHILSRLHEQLVTGGGAAGAAPAGVVAAS